jgi:hypothetical protein
MTELTFNDRAIRELRRQCLHHNVFPLFLGHCLGGKPLRVYSVLRPIFDNCIEQLAQMDFPEVKQVVDSAPAGYRMMLQPIEEPISTEYLRRVAEYCIAAEVQKGYSPVSSVLRPSPDESEVLTTCPELKSRFDGDGLLLLSDDFELFDGGIRYGKYFLHYHQFLRRGFSSNPNFDFLGTLARYRNRASPESSFRVAVDHRRIMRFDDYQQFTESDTWYGPAFNRDKLDDLAYLGLTVVGRAHLSSLDSYPLLRTEFLWKANEGELIKTLEIEELSCPSGPYDNWHINRYLHAERDTKRRTFRHLDGAVKIYAQSNYKERIQQEMPRNPKPAHYIKLFRVDGSIDLDDWLSIVSMFYKGNEMLIEYFDPGLFNQKIRPMRERMYRALNQ